MKTAAYSMIFDGGSFAVEPWRKDDITTAGGWLCNALLEKLKNIWRQCFLCSFIVGIKKLLLEKSQTAARHFLLVDQQITAGQRRGQRCHVVEQIGLFKRCMTGQPARRAD